MLLIRTRHLPHSPCTSLRQLSASRRPLILSLAFPRQRSAGGQGPLARDPDLAAVEAALFAADEPLNSRKLASVAGLADANAARRLVRRLQSLYDQGGSAFQVEEFAGGFQLLTQPEFHSWLARLRQTRQDVRLSGAARETLAIIAYKQPIMRADVEAIRGVQCGDVLRVLMEKGLIRITGRHHSLGRPVLYGTTKKFLQVFGLKSLEELPLSEQLRAPAAASPSSPPPPVAPEAPGPT